MFISVQLYMRVEGQGTKAGFREPVASRQDTHSASVGAEVWRKINDRLSARGFQLACGLGVNGSVKLTTTQQLNPAEIMAVWEAAVGAMREIDAATQE